MKKLTISLVCLIVLAAFAGSAFAQGARPAAQTPPATGGATGPVPDSKVAIVNTGMFFDDKAGILKLNAAMDRVDAEFKVKEQELKNLNADIEKRSEDIRKQAALIGTPNSPVKEDDLRARAEQVETMKKDLKRKLEDAQAAYQKRLVDVQTPIFQDIVKALDVFAKQRGITLTLNAAKMPEAILTFVPSIDITDAFIKDYNSRNPATASVVAPR